MRDEMNKMKLEEFVPLFAEQFDDTDPAEISATTVFKDLDEWSSLTALTIIAMAKTAFGKTITGREVRSCETVEDLYNMIISK